jgi:casein kinase I family protein HRR25
MTLDRQSIHIQEKIASGSFGDVHKGTDLVTGKKIAIKIETVKSTQLKQEAMVYKALDGVRINAKLSWPKMHYYGIDSTKKSNILVMDLYGQNLDMILKKQRNFFTSNIAFFYKFAKEMIKLVEIFHNHGFVHRDIKPQNFVMESDMSFHPLLIDYGLTKKYLSTDKKTHYPFQDNKSLKGTIRFVSVNTHLGVDASRRDDLVSLGYVFLYMLNINLPWQNKIKSNSDKKVVYKEIMVLKMATTIEELTIGMTDSVLQKNLLLFLFYSNSLMFHQVPDYKYIYSLFTPN